MPVLIAVLVQESRLWGRTDPGALEPWTREALPAGTALQGDEKLRALREEVARAAVDWPGVILAAVFSEPDLHRWQVGGDRECLVCTRGEAQPEWRQLPSRVDLLLDRFAAADPALPCEGNLTDLVRAGWPESDFQGGHYWILSSLTGPDQEPVLLLSVVQRRTLDRPGFRAFLDRMRAQFGPLLAVQQHLEVLRGELTSIQAENEVLARLNRMQGDFVAVASHELKTPLTSIIAYAEVLQQNLQEKEFAQSEEFLDIVKTEAERLLRMVNRILDFSRLEFGDRMLDRQPVAPEPLIRSTARTLQPHLERKDLKLDFDFPEDLPRVEVESDLIRQVVINLISNAIKFTPAGSEITVAGREDAGTVRIDVRDNGPGIPAVELHRIFRQFYRLRGPSSAQDGAGLGLTIVKNIIDMHNGHIDVQSREGRGTTFSFHLPKQHHFNPAPANLLGDLVSEGTFQTVLRLSVRMIAELMEVRKVALLIRDQDQPDLVIQSALGLSRSFVGSFRADGDEGVLARVMQSREPALGGDRLRAAGQTATAVAEPWWEAVVPLPVGDEVIGLVTAADKVDGEPLGEDDLHLLATLVEKVAVAMAAVLQGGTGDLAGVIEALQALVQMKHSCIPTVNPLALRLLDKTARKLGLSPAEAKRLQYVASLHDAGMVRVDREIIGKASHLDPDEKDLVGNHVTDGAQLMAPLLGSREMEEIILTHHERVDGTGYPAGRQGEEIPLGGRILAVLDAFFAMIQNRPYRPGRPAAEVAEEIRQHIGTQFDPTIVEVFLEVLAEEGILTDGEGTVPDRSGRDTAFRDESETSWQRQGY